MVQEQIYEVMVRSVNDDGDYNDLYYLLKKILYNDVMMILLFIILFIIITHLK